MSLRNAGLRRRLTDIKRASALKSWQETIMSDRTGNEPAPLVLIGVAVLPIIAVLAWFAF